MIIGSMRKAYVFPGSRQDANDYDNLFSMLKSKGFEPLAVAIDWEKASFKQYLAEAKRQIAGAKSNDIFLGFSYGSNIAMAVKNGTGIRAILCSTPNLYDLGKRRLFDKISGLSMDWQEVDKLDLAAVSTDNMSFVAGSEEKIYSVFAQHLGSLYDVKPSIIQGAAHNIDSPAYVDGLETII